MRGMLYLEDLEAPVKDFIGRIKVKLIKLTKYVAIAAAVLWVIYTI